MTINKAQGKALFGKAAAWEIMFIARPIDPLSALAAWLENPRACEAAAVMIKSLRREKETKPVRATHCLLCDRNFLHRLPAVLVVMAPAVRNGPGSGFALCDGCAAQPDLKGRVHAYLHAKFGAQWVQWGTV